jgi:hypothetical protein
MSIYFTKLFQSITESTIWVEPNAVRIVWITMLAMADKKGRVFASIPGLANRARVEVEECRMAINTFLSPDAESRTSDHEGRRIMPIDGGWVLLNHAKYRAIQDDETIAESKRKWAQKNRESKKVDKVEVGRSQAIQTEAEADAVIKESKLSLACAQDKLETPALAVKSNKLAIPDCPHKEILEIWAQELPAMPQHSENLWKGLRADHLRARWREQAVLNKWTTQADGLKYFGNLFSYIGHSEFLMGKAKVRQGSRPFYIELAWLVNPNNWAKVLEGTYHPEEKA